MATLAMKRGRVRAQVTKMEEEMKQAVDECNRELAEELLDKLKKKEERLEEYNDQIAATLSPEQEEDDREIDHYEDFIDRWNTRLRRVINGRITTGVCDEPRIEMNTDRPSRFSSSDPTTTIGGVKLRLPKFEILKYNGDVLKWQTFWNTYAAAVHNQPGLCAIDKFNYLRSLLVGDAFRCIEGLSITPENYQVAVERLEKRFGRTDQIVDSTMMSFARLPPPRLDPVSLRRFFDDVEVKLLGLKSLKVDVDACGGILRPMLVKLLPREIQLAWARHSKKRENENNSRPCLGDFIEFLREEVELREGLHLANGEEQRRDYRNDRAGRISASASALSLTASNKDKPTRKLQKCQICEGVNHNAVYCPINSLSERYERLKGSRRCFNCLWFGHNKVMCTRDTAKCHFCKRSHHSALCPQRFGEKEDNAGKNADLIKGDDAGKGSKPSDVSSLVTKSNDVSANHIAGSNVVMLQSAIVIVDGMTSQVKARCLLDGGSQRSFISRGLARKVNAKEVGTERMAIGVFGHGLEEAKDFRKVSVKLFDSKGSNCVDVVLREVDSLCSNYSLLPSRWIERNMSEYGFPLADPVRQMNDPVEPVEILIGSDYYWSIVTGQVKHLTRRIVAVESIFGWLVQGPDDRHESSENNMTTVSMHVAVKDSVGTRESQQFKKEMEDFWSLEKLGISHEEEVKDCGSAVLNEFNERLTKSQGRYVVSLPWNERKEELQSNWNEAIRRFFVLTRKLMRDQQQMEAYHKAMIEYVESDHAERVSDEIGQHKDNEPLYYIPHHAVVRTNHDTTKLRIVFDASAGKPSLNDCLHAGPHLNPDVFDLLLRFRQNNVVLVADMEKAFLQVVINPEDRDAARFIWLPLDWKFGDATVPCVYRMKRVLFGLNCGPFLLAATLRHHLDSNFDNYPHSVAMLRESIYVDDMVKSVPTVTQGLRLYTEAKKIMNEAGFNLRKWATNSPELKAEMSACGESSDDPFSTRLEETLKVLGVTWNQQKDLVLFDVSELMTFVEGQSVTKRLVLRTMARIFDPLGLVSPFTIRLKCLFQKLWQKGFEWDEELSGKFYDEWSEWIRELELLPRLSIPRCVSISQSVVHRKLHAFSDASRSALGACVYLVETSENGESHSTLVASKGRVAPLKTLTIPRLELVGALLCARLTCTVRRAMGFNNIETSFWTDSMIALFWIQGDENRWKLFVANRVKEIKKLSGDAKWRHVRTNDNPADKITRGMNAEALQGDLSWWEGPSWLCQTIQEVETDMDDCLRQEAMVEGQSLSLVEVNATVTAEFLWDVTRFSRWSKLVRVIGWVLRFLSYRHPEPRVKGPLTVEELRQAEIVVLRQEQRSVYPAEYEALEAKRSVPRSSKILRFNPDLDDEGLLRLGGRLHFSMLDYDTKHPVILNSGSWVTRLIVMDCHNRVQHGGVSETMTEVRERYWVVNARSSIRRILRKCSVCQKRRQKPAQVIEAPLPSDRIEVAQPFEVVGLDYAGPVYVRETRNVQRKTYVLLFTCAVTRALHLELVSSMTIDDFLLAFRRFVSRRGYCRVIWSDNAKTFKRADKDLRLWDSLVNSKVVKEFTAERRIEWKFIVDRAPWWGGMWERMIRSVKDKVKVVCGRAMLTFDEFRTILVEVEAVLNSRPLGYVTDDKTQILTPAHLLVGRRLTVLPPPSKAAERIGGDREIGKRWRVRLTLMQRFWKLWRNDYLLQLKTAHERKNVLERTKLKEGQVVLLDDERPNRQLWKTCVIKELIQGRDGMARSCLLQLPCGKIIRRPIQLLYPMEIM